MESVAILMDFLKKIALILNKVQMERRKLDRNMGNIEIYRRRMDKLLRKVF